MVITPGTARSELHAARAGGEYPDRIAGEQPERPGREMGFEIRGIEPLGQVCRFAKALGLVRDLEVDAVVTDLNATVREAGMRARKLGVEIN